MLGLDLKTIAQATDLSINLVRQQVTADLALASRQAHRAGEKLTPKIQTRLATCLYCFLERIKQ